MARRPKSDEAPPDADPAAMAESVASWTAELGRASHLPPSWPIDHRPDGEKPCRMCGFRDWWGGRGRGWCCMVCHPATDKQLSKSDRVTVGQERDAA